MLFNKKFSISRIINDIFQLSFFIIISVATIYIIDFYALGYVWRGVSRPNFETIYFVRTSIVFVVATLVIVSFIKINPSDKTRKLSNELSKPSVEWSWVSFSRSSRQWSIVLILCFSFFYLYVFLDNPTLFRNLSTDEKAVENLSAIFSLLASIVFMISGFSLRKNNFKFSKLYPVLALFFSVLFFVIAMEEIAWTQGIFHFDTPELFSDNSQNELNIHNYNTYTFELAYYFSTFLFFIIIPFFNERKSTFEQIPVISFFTPSRFMVYIGAIMVAYNYDMWNNLFFQFSFFITLFILVYYAWIDRIDNHQILLTILIIIYFTSQLSFLLFGYRVTRTPSFKEYKEFFIPLTFFLYSLEVYLRTKLINNDVFKKIVGL